VANTVTLLKDHKGMTTPKVHGDEYYVDCAVNITTYSGSTDGEGEIVTAASLGLSRINAVLVTGQETKSYVPMVEIAAADGDYASRKQLVIKLLTHDASDSSNDVLVEAAHSLSDLGMVRLRVYGIL
jgi:hypothetical protein|tara:strand:+ start:487 stop:867 length:381 start_codon:yes stop_codon:yes gene_type:complete